MLHLFMKKKSHSNVTSVTTAVLKKTNEATCCKKA
jgi:hypothetical protein